MCECYKAPSALKKLDFVQVEICLSEWAVAGLAKCLPWEHVLKGKIEIDIKKNVVKVCYIKITNLI